MKVLRRSQQLLGASALLVSALLVTDGCSSSTTSRLCGDFEVVAGRSNGAAVSQYLDLTVRNEASNSCRVPEITAMEFLAQGENVNVRGEPDPAPPQFERATHMSGKESAQIFLRRASNCPADLPADQTAVDTAVLELSSGESLEVAIDLDGCGPIQFSQVGHRE